MVAFLHEGCCTMHFLRVHLFSGQVSTGLLNGVKVEGR
jgi:hypothetical protein